MWGPVNALLKIWNATYNIDFATTETKMLDNRVRTLLGSAKALAPPRNQVKAHATFIEAFTVLRAVFGYSLTYFNSQGVDQQALLNANIKIQEFNKLLQRYDQENG